MVKMTGCLSYGNGGDGIVIAGTDVELEGCVAHSNGGDGFRMVGEKEALGRQFIEAVQGGISAEEAQRIYGEPLAKHGFNLQTMLETGANLASIASAVAALFGLCG